MVSRLTTGRERFRDAWGEMQEVRAESERLGTRLRQLVDEDADAFRSVMAARRLPKSSDAESSAREGAIQEATLRSARVPLETLESLARLSALASAAARRGNSGCLTDAGSAAQLIRAGAVAASYNVRVNLPSLADTAIRQQLSAETARALAEVFAATESIEKEVESGLGDRSGT
jgi:formiminotetrahydrofolate cyclodeaminase